MADTDGTSDPDDMPFGEYLFHAKKLRHGKRTKHTTHSTRTSRAREQETTNDD